MKKNLMGLAVTLIWLGLCFSTAAAKEEIVFAETALVTGVFGFAGTEFHDGIVDYINYLNEKGGIRGHRIKHVFEDCGYKVDCSVATFKKLTSEHRPLFYSGDSTGFMKAINSELKTTENTLMSGVSFATEIADESVYPRSFLLGPTYTDQFGILLTYASQNKPGAKVAIVHSDTGFGRDPIKAGIAKAKALGLNLVEVITTKPGSVDVSTEVLKLRRKKPDYVLFHGYVLSPINEFMQQMKDLGMKTEFMGTYWSSSEMMYMKAKEVSDGYLGVQHLNYFQMDESPGKEWDTMRAYNAKAHPDKVNRPNFYMFGWFQTMVWAEVIGRTIDAGKPLTVENLRATLNAIENWDTGGITSIPVTIRNNSIPVGRIFRVNAAAGKYEPVSEVIEIK
jgi:branched-chain amino acid transport system substrate-binding protein